MKKFFSFLLAVLFACSALILSSCKNTEEKPNKNSSKLSVVCTIFPYYDFARSIAADRVDLKLLLSPGSEPHSYDPSPSDIVAIENCDVFIYNGGESDEWVENVLSSIQNKDIVVLKMTDYVKLLYEYNPDTGEYGDEYDEHIWTSPENAQKLVLQMEAAFSAEDEKNKDFYNENSLKYVDMLKDLDNNIKDITTNARRNTIVFGDRFPFLYFTNRYSLNVDCAFPGCSSETEPSISTVKRLIDFTRNEEIPVVLFLEFSNGRVARLISEDSNAVARKFSSCHNVTKEEFEQGETYISLMEQNAEVLKEALN